MSEIALQIEDLSYSGVLFVCSNYFIESKIYMLLFFGNEKLLFYK